MKLILQYPLKNVVVTQRFGETANLAYYKANGLNFKGHNGEDMQAAHGEPVYAAHDGTCYPEVDAQGGNGVVIRTLQPFEYHDIEVYFKTIYWHLVKADAVVKTGQQIKAGDLIGYADSTGLSTGDHLHFGLKAQGWNEENWQWYTLNVDNGYMGAIDPDPYFDKAPKPLKLTFTRDLEVGATGDDVKLLQAFLIGMGLLKSQATGYFGSLTEAAVKEFQRTHDLQQIGRVGPKTRAFLNDLIP